MDQRTAQDPRSLGQVIGDAVGNIQGIIRSEIQLAKAEVKEDAKSVGKAAAMLVVGVVLGLYAFGLLLFTITWAIATQLSLWLSALIVTVVIAAIAGILMAVGRSRMKKVDPKPDRTMGSVKEDISWAKQQTKRQAR